MNDESNGLPIVEFISLWVRMYSCHTINGVAHRLAKKLSRLASHVLTIKEHVAPVWSHLCCSTTIYALSLAGKHFVGRLCGVHYTAI